jgi:hypothetical protein
MVMAGNLFALALLEIAGQAKRVLSVSVIDMLA